MARIQSLALPGDRFLLVIDECGDDFPLEPDRVGEFRESCGAQGVIMCESTMDVA